MRRDELPPPFDLSFGRAFLSAYALWFSYFLRGTGRESWGNRAQARPYLCNPFGKGFLIPNPMLWGGDPFEKFTQAGLYFRKKFAHPPTHPNTGNPVTTFVKMGVAAALGR